MEDKMETGLYRSKYWDTYQHVQCEDFGKSSPYIIGARRPPWVVTSVLSWFVPGVYAPWTCLCFVLSASCSINIAFSGSAAKPQSSDVESLYWKPAGRSKP